MKRVILTLVLLSAVVVAGDFSRANDIVVDNRTNLMWQDDSDANTTKRDWSDAITNCEALALAGHNDWRLPNINELYTIVDKSRSDPAMDTIFVNVNSTDYWSSTTTLDNVANAWFISFYRGLIVERSNGKTNAYYVRCVRDN